MWDIGGGRWFYGYVGADYYSLRDVALAVGVIENPDAKPGYLRYRYNLRVSWNWLPTRRYEMADHAWYGGVASVRWTGREKAFTGFVGWPFLLEFTRG